MNGIYTKFMKMVLERNLTNVVDFFLFYLYNSFMILLCLYKKKYTK